MSGGETGTSRVTSRRPWLVIAGIGLALIAQLLVSRQTYVAAIPLYAIAVGLSVFGGIAPARRLLDLPDFAVAAVKLPSPRVLGLCVVASLFVLLSVVRFDVHNASNADFALWVLAVFVLVVAVSWQMPSGPRRGLSPPPVPTPGTLVVVVACFAVAVLPRVIDLGSLPFGFWFDEAENALQGRRIRAEGTYRPVFIPGTFLAPAHLAYLMALFSGLFGDTVVAARLVTVFLGVVSIGAAGAATRWLWGPWAGALVMLLLGLSRWHVTISRIAMHNIAVPAFAFATLALLLRALRSGRRRDWAFAGLIAGTGLGFYSAFAASLLAVGLVALLIIIRQRAVGRAALGVAISLLVLAAATGPVLKFAQQDSDLFFTRQDQTSLFSTVPDDEQTDRIIDNVGAYLRSFNDVGDRNGRHNEPGRSMLPVWLSPLAVIGLGLCLANLRRPVAAGLVLWFVLGLVPGVLSNPGEAPNTLRSIGTMAPAYLFACLTVLVVTTTRPFDHIMAYDRFGEWAASLRGEAKLAPIAGALTLALVLIGGVVDVSTYFGSQADHPVVWGDHSTPATLAAKLALSGVESHEVWLVEGLHAEPSTMRFLIDDFAPYQRYRPSDGTLLPFTGERDVLVIGHAGTGTSADLLMSVYDGVVATEHAVRPGEHPAAVSLQIPAASIRARQGVSFVEEGAAETSVPTFDAAPRSGTPAQWSGGLVAPSNDDYTFRVTGDSASELIIDGVAVRLCPGGATEGTLRLGRGTHELRLSAGPGVAPVGLEWRGSTGDWLPIEQRFLIQPPWYRQGLLASHYPGTSAEGPPTFRRIDGGANFDFWIPRLPSPVTTVWSGALNIETPGLYRFWLNSDDPASLGIAGTEVASTPIEGGEELYEARLEPGSYQIDVSATDIEPWAHVRLDWEPPEGGRGRIPPRLLSPDFSGPAVGMALVGETC